jgi:acyl carrier protein
MSIENYFNVSITDEETPMLKSAGDMVKLIERKLEG